MTTRGVLSPLTNTPNSTRRPPQTKYVSPSTTRQPGLGVSSSSTISLLSEPHDDEKERRDRRRSRIMELQRNLGTSPGASPSEKRGTPLNGLTSAQLAEHYTNCIQLSAENKINSKNAFGLHLIDYMAELLKKKELENFQVASSTLDASAKIYAGRVDCIHSETYKVLSGLVTGSSKTQSVEQEDNGTGYDDDREDPKKKRKTKSKIIRTNLKAINVNKFDLKFQVDPMFQVMSATFDERGASGLLLNNLRCYDNKQLLILDSSAVVPVLDEKAGGEEQLHQLAPDCVDMAQVIDLVEKMDLEEKHICPALNEFRLTGWDSNEQNSVFYKGLSGLTLDPHGEVDSTSAAEDDLASLPGDIDPEDLHDISDGEMDNPDDGDEGNQPAQHLGDIKGDSQTAEFIHNAFNDLTQGSSGKLMQVLASQSTDYSYFNKVLMRTWAGPVHWKTAPVLRVHVCNKKTQVKSKRLPFCLTYEKCDDLEGKFKTSKATALTKATLQKYTKKKTTVPEDLHFQADKLFRLFYRSSVMVKRQDADVIGVDDSIGNYDYDNVNDRENFCPDLGGDNDDDSPDLGFNFSDDSNGYSEASCYHVSQPSLASNDSTLNATSLTGDKLLSQPYKVAKIDISYAKMAKRIDVGKLKTAMWHLLTSQPPKDAQRQVKQMTSVPPEESAMQMEWRFQSLLEVLPSCVSVSIATNLSVPIAFVCLLHLANEKTLKVFDQDMSDLTIGQDL